METFAKSFDQFISTISRDSKIPQIIENIQYYHDCYDAALAQPKGDNNLQFLGMDTEELRAELFYNNANDFETSIFSETFSYVLFYFCIFSIQEIETLNLAHLCVDLWTIQVTD